MNIKKLKLALIKAQECAAILEKAGDNDPTALDFVNMAETTIQEAITHASIEESIV